MKKIWLAAAGLTVVLVGGAAVAQAAGYGIGGYGRGYGMMGGGYGPGAGRAGYGPGYGMMGGGFGPGAGGAGLACNPAGGTFDKDTALAQNSAMVARQEANLAALNEQLKTAATDSQKTWLNGRIEQVSIQMDWQKGRTDVLKGLSGKWPADAIALAQYDVDFYGKATAADAGNKAWIAARLEAAKSRLEYLQKQQDGSTAQP